jgi:hypothetical protein
VTDERRDRHAGHRRTFRPPGGIYEDAQAKLAEAQKGEPGEPWKMNDLLSGALAAFNENPVGMLRRLKKSWTPPKKGRPPKTDGPDGPVGEPFQDPA